MREHPPHFLVTGTFSNLFTGNAPLQASYNITSTDWVYFAQALRRTPTFVREHIRAQAEAMVVENEFNDAQKQRDFWKAIANGRRI
jgi:hypothetical protein